MYSLGYIISNNLLIYQKSTPSNYIVGIYPTNIIISIWDIYPPVIKYGCWKIPNDSTLRSKPSFFIMDVPLPYQLTIYNHGKYPIILDITMVFFTDYWLIWLIWLMNILRIVT